jgi:hypothetical protein
MSRFLMRMLPVLLLPALALALFEGAPPVAAQDTYSISGVVYFDTDMDGERDADERPAPNATVELLGGSQHATATSGSDGRYSFTGLLPDYNADFTLRMVLDSEIPCSTTFARDVPSGTDSTGVDFGVFDSGTKRISGTLLSDVNENGVYDLGEPGLGGWQVRVYGQGGQGGNWWLAYCDMKTTSDASGQFAFSRLVPGIFFLELTPPPSLAGALREKTFLLPDNNVFNSVDLTQTAEVQDVEIGIHFLEGTGTITGKIFVDDDRDGVWDEGEPSGCNPNIVYDMNMLYASREVPGLGTLQTEPEPVPAVCEYGIYRISGLPAGVYNVHTMFDCTPAQAGSPAQPSGSLGRWVVLGEGQSVDGVDLITCPPPPPMLTEEPLPTLEPTPTALTPAPSPLSSGLAAPATGTGGASSDNGLAGFAPALAAAGTLAVCGAALLHRRQARARPTHRPEGE